MSFVIEFLLLIVCFLLAFLLGKNIERQKNVQQKTLFSKKVASLRRRLDNADVLGRLRNKYKR